MNKRNLAPLIVDILNAIKTLLNKRFNSLYEQQKTKVNVMLYASPTFSKAYSYKEDFLSILYSKSREEAQKQLIKWINYASICGIEPFQKCAKTILVWNNAILNSFTTIILMAS